MKKTSVIILFLISSLTFKAADTLKIFYYSNFPFAYKENGVIKGIDVDIIKEYEKFSKEKKAIDLITTYTEYTDLDKFQSDLKSASKNVVGIGGITYTKARSTNFNFTSAYLKNVSVLVCHGNIPTIRSTNSTDIKASLDKMTAITVKNSTHETYVNDLKKSMPTLKVEFEANLQDVLKKIEANKTGFGYVDLIAYWAYSKKMKEGSYLKIQRLLNKGDETFSMILPKNEVMAGHLNEFFDSGFGFTSTKLYHEILSKYLGYEVLESVEVN